ncbi:MAG: O-acetyl-ADP-ribose deacetylase [Dehalococcoidales bacterium]|nr:O-acetyl-ADP-ribose deacetylase [Dehalococcoidales bacterium]
MEKSVSSIKISDTTLSIIQGDITAQKTDAIVNAANSGLMGGGGVDGAIHRAGGSAILEECKQIVKKQGRLPTGKAVITTGGNLPANYVIHTVGPVWNGGNNGESELLASAYRESLALAAEHNLKSVSFPSISTGIYGYPVEKAALVAVSTVKDFLKNRKSSIKDITFVLFDAGTYSAYARQLE